MTTRTATREDLNELLGLPEAARLAAGLTTLARDQDGRWWLADEHPRQTWELAKMVSRPILSMATLGIRKALPKKVLQRLPELLKLR